jgi:hypothetical protein
MAFVACFTSVIWLCEVGKYVNVVVVLTVLLFVIPASARYRNLEVPVFFLDTKQGYTVKKTEKDKWIWYVLTGANMTVMKRSSRMVYRLMPTHFEH